MLIIGHRGAAGLMAENTIRSFQKAQDLGADMIEFDVRLTKDLQVVISHDRNLERLYKVGKKIANLTVDELKQISNSNIPTLAEALENISIPVNIEVKEHGLERQLLKDLKNFSHKVLISSIYPGVLKKIRALDEKVSLGLIIGKGELHLLPILRYLTRDLNLYSIHPKNILVSRISVALLRKLRNKILVWTVDKISEYHKLEKLGVDGIFTNYPDKMIKLRK